MYSDSSAFSDSYATVARPGTAELREKGSRFIAEVLAVTSAEDAEREIEIVRTREHAATHVCTAYRVGTDGDIFRYNDDGEPAGTAGPPILRQIDGRGLTNTLVAVTRYYGGTKLGTGGLVRAYGAAAAEALDAAGRVERVIRVRFRLDYAYDETTQATQVINRLNGEVVKSDYADRARLVVSVPRSRAREFEIAFTEALGGRGKAERVE